MSSSDPWTLTPIARLHSPFKQKFAIPRQANLVPEAIGSLEFTAEFADPNFFRGLQQFSHLWLLFRFHATADQGFSPTVQPPRLGGKERVGVFASRSPFRPNSLGLSVVRNLGLEAVAGRPRLRVGGIDLLDGTPIVDIKPYLPWADAIAGASAGFADSRPASWDGVVFAEAAEASLNELAADYPDLQALISSILKQDPRPAWRAGKEDEKQYGMTLYDLNIKWRVQAGGVRVLSISRQEDDHVDAE